MRNLISIILIVFFFSCNIPSNTKIGANTQDRKDLNNSKEYALKSTPDISIALKFINDYADHCMSNILERDSDWISNNKLLTDNFNKRYNYILDSANMADPDVGLDSDPIFNAQDFPDKGFEFAGCDQDGYITVKGKDWPDFLLVMKMDYQNGRWLVDGVGIINIPGNKRAKR